MHPEYGEYGFTRPGDSLYRSKALQYKARLRLILNWNPDLIFYFFFNSLIPDPTRKDVHKPNLDSVDDPPHPLHAPPQPVIDYILDHKGLRKDPAYNTLCALTNLGWCLETWRGGICSKKLSEMHKIHPIIRIGPNQIPSRTDTTTHFRESSTGVFEFSSSINILYHENYN
jgi:hypothetical protein